jgi:regulator of replication initiation timing
MNQEINIQIKAIKAKITEVVANNNALLKENEQLKAKLQISISDNNSNIENMQILQQKINALQLLAGNTNEPDKKELRKTVDKYIADINKTITLLSQ